MLSLGTAEKDLRCRQALSAMLNDQIQKNEELQTDNLLLEEEQRRLLSLLQIKMEEIQRLQLSKAYLGNDSTLQMTQLSARQPKVGHEEAKTMKAKISNLQSAIREKEEEMSRLRSYFTGVIEKLDQQNRSQHKERQMGDKSNDKLEVDKIKGENHSLHEIILRSNQKIRQLSQELIMAEQRCQQLQQLSKGQQQAKEQLEITKMEMDSLTRQIEDKLIDIRVQHGEREMKKQKQFEDKLGKQRKDYEDRLQKARKQSEQQLSHLKNDYEERINFMIVSSEDDKAELKQKYIEEAKACILSELEIESQQNGHQILSLQERLATTEEAVKNINQKYEEQSQIVINLEDDLAHSKNAQTKLQGQLKRITSQLEKRKSEFSGMEEQYRAQKENNEFFETNFKKLADQVKDKDSANIKLTNELRKAEATHKKASLEMQEITKRCQLLQQELNNNSAELQLKSDEIDRLNTKITKQAERKDKLLGESRKIIKEQQLQMEAIKNKLTKYELDQQSRQGQHNEKLKELRQTLAKINDQKSKVSKENKTIKEEVYKMEQQVKTNFLQFQRQIQQLTQEKECLSENNNNLLTQKENYRRVYETNSQELIKAKQKIAKYEEKIEKLTVSLNNCQEEIDCLKEEITSQQVHQHEKQENDKHKQEIIDLKAKINHLNDSLNKLKRQHSDLTRDTIVLHQQNSKLKDERDRNQNKAVLLKNQKTKLQEKVRELRDELDQRCQKMQSQMPYINNIIEQKKQLERQMQELAKENKRKDHLLEVAKRSKAQELISMQKECAQLRKKDRGTQKELEELRTTIEQLNRERINTHREVTNRDDHIRKVKEDNKSLKIELKRLEATCEGQEKQIEELYKMLETIENNEMQ